MMVYNNNSVPLVGEQTIPTERQPLSVKLVPTFAARQVSHSQRSRSPMAVISVF
jgi:hypothetical protein